MPLALRRLEGAGQWAVFLLGLFLFLFGLPLVVGGAKLVTIAGSLYYLPAGLAFVVSGALLMTRRPLGIKHAVARLAPQLLVIGTHGRTGIKRVLLGSIAEQVINQVECDVLVVPTRRTE